LGDGGRFGAQIAPAGARDASANALTR
jgi:hypothetical protein